ncbi:MAG: hypothetical protein JWM11_299 [Planctomycetaceae bacterium]|nr:hypothetical protein [Planctomycetaceae bacterium]
MRCDSKLGEVRHRFAGFTLCPENIKIVVMLNPKDSSPTPRTLLTPLGSLFASPWFALIAVAIAELLTFRSVHNGLIADDYFHRAVLSGSNRFGELLPGPQGMFRFADGDPVHTRAWMDVGWQPWWTDPDIKAEFFQFIPTQTHILDYWLWPDRPELMHVHSLVWLALLVFLVAKFYQRILGPTWMAGVAALLFAIEDGHALPVGWICNRNSMIAASFGIGCLIAHDLWRREGKRWAFWLALVLWVASLCSKEEGIATCAYLFAYALWLDGATIGKRILTLVPYGLLLIVWRIGRDSLGFGVAHVGSYVDPFTDAGRFFTAFFERYPVLLLGQWAGLSELWVVFGSMIWWIAVGYVCLLGLVFWPLLRRDRIARFFATGMLLAVIPVCATFPMDRLLMFTGLGAFGLMVRFWNAVFAPDECTAKDHVAESGRIRGFEVPASELSQDSATRTLPSENPSRRSMDGLRRGFGLWRVVAVPVALLLVLFHVIAAPFLLNLRVSAPWGSREFTDAMFPTVHFDPSIEQQDLILVNPPVAWLAGYCLFQYEHAGLPAPRAVRSLAPGIDGVTVRRTGDRTIEVIPFNGYIKFPDSLLRNEQYPLKLSEQVHLARMIATVLSIEAERPKIVAFSFETPLEDKSLRWIQYRDGEYVPFIPPAIGEEVFLPGRGGPLKRWRGNQ